MSLSQVLKSLRTATSRAARDLRQEACRGCYYSCSRTAAFIIRDNTHELTCMPNDTKGVNIALVRVNGLARLPNVRKMERFFIPTAPLLILGCLCVSRVAADSLEAPVNVTIKALKANSAVVTWDIPEGDPVIGFAITQQKKDVRMLRFIQEVNTTTRSCALWDLEEETDYIVHVQSISMSGHASPLSEPLRFRTPREAETQASKSKDEVTMEEVGQSTQLRAGECIIIVVVLIMWAGVIALFCRQYDIIKDNEPNNNKDKAKTSSECSTPEHPSGGLLRSKYDDNDNNNNNRMPTINFIEV